MKLKCNQMMYSYKFYFFLRDQSLKKWVKYLKILITNKRFYLFTEIFRRSTRIETFNRLATKIENFHRLPTKLLNFNRQLTSGPPHSDPLTIFFSSLISTRNNTIAQSACGICKNIPYVSIKSSRQRLHV